MKTLHLLRHGKSSWDNPKIDDHDRPLAPRGVKAAARVGRYLRAHGPVPRLVLCSTARRAVETLTIVLDALAGDVTVERERGLYLCGSGALLQRLREAPDSADTLMLIGHNPDMHELATALAAEGGETALRALAAKFPTGACATIRFPVDHWAEVAPGGGHLDTYILPRTLA